MDVAPCISFSFGKEEKSFSSLEVIFFSRREKENISFAKEGKSSSSLEQKTGSPSYSEE